MAAEEKREGFVEKHIFNLAGAFVLLLGAVLYPSVWFLWKAVTGHELPGKPVLSVQNLIATAVMLFAAALAWLLYKRKTFQPGIESRAFAIRARALKRLESGWIGLFFEPSIEGKEPICLPLRFAPSFVEHPGIEEAASILKNYDGELPLGTSIDEVFNKSGRSLLVLGEPGSGKTTLLLQLSKHLHGLAAQDLSQPIPVFLRLANWNRWWGLLSGQRAFERWLIRQMKVSYFIDKDLGREWLRAGKVVLLLDGLDEIVTPKARRSCRNAIHELASRLQGGLVVASRTEEYLTLNRLPMEVAIEALPVTEPQVLQYVAAIPSARRLALALRNDPSAITVLTTPFALTLALAAYSNRSRLHWQSEGRFSISKLLDDFVNAKLSIHLKNSRYRKEAFLRWSRNLAQCSKLGKQTVFDPVELRERWFSSIWIHSICKGLVVLAVVVFCFLVEQMLWFFAYLLTATCANGSAVAPCVILALHPGYVRLIWNTLPAMLFGAAIQAIIAACVVGLPVGIFGSLFQLRPVQFAPAVFLSSRIRQSLRILVVASVGIGVALTPIGLILREFFKQKVVPEQWDWSSNPLNQLRGPLYAGVGYFVGASLTIRACVLIGLCIGLLLALNTLLSSEFNSNRKLSSTIRTSILMSLSLGTIAGVLLWFSLPLSRIESMTSLGTDIVSKEDIPFGGALLIVLAAGGLFTIRHYVTRLMMIATRRGPWDYSLFLDLATECGFLRPVSGPDRIFRHPMLRDYFANPPSRGEP